MPKQVKHTDWTAKGRLAIIRKQNAERHAGYEAKQKLRQKHYKAAGESHASIGAR